MFYFRNLVTRKHPSGQGLLEATLAIGIIMVGLGALMSVTLQSVGATSVSDKQLVGQNLAREAIEVVRSMRDSNWLKASNSDPTVVWDAGLVSQDNQAAVIEFVPQVSGSGVFNLAFINTRDVDDSNESLLHVYRGGQDSLTGDSYLWLQSASPEAGYIDTGFRRIIALDPVCQPSAGSSYVNVAKMDCNVGDQKIGIRVEARVSWSSGGLFSGTRRSVSMVEFLYNWK